MGVLSWKILFYKFKTRMYRERERSEKTCLINNLIEILYIYNEKSWFQVFLIKLNPLFGLQ